MGLTQVNGKARSPGSSTWLRGMIKTMKLDLELNASLHDTPMYLSGYDLVSVLPKRNFTKNGYRIFENCPLYDILKEPSLRSTTFVGGFKGP